MPSYVVKCFNPQCKNTMVHGCESPRKFWCYLVDNYWRPIKLPSGKELMLCPSCSNLLEEQVQQLLKSLEDRPPQEDDK